MKFIGDKPQSFMFRAVRANPFALEYIENQSEKLCFGAISKNPNSLKFVKNQSEKNVIWALSIVDRCLKYFDEKYKTENIFREAIEIKIWNHQIVMQIKQK
jgi:hypothetical protein